MLSRKPNIDTPNFAGAENRTSSLVNDLIVHDFKIEFEKCIIPFKAPSTIEEDIRKHAWDCFNTDLHTITIWRDNELNHWPAIYIGQNVKTIGQDVITIGRDVKTIGQDVKTTGRGVISTRQVVKTIGRDVKTNTQDDITSGQDGITKSKHDITSDQDSITKSKDNITSIQDAINNRKDVISKRKGVITMSKDVITNPREGITNRWGNKDLRWYEITRGKRAITECKCIFKAFEETKAAEWLAICTEQFIDKNVVFYNLSAKFRRFARKTSNFF